MTVEQRARYEAIRTDKIAKRAKLSAALDSALEVADIQTFSLNDPEGGQSVTRRDPATLMTMIETLDRQIEYYDRLLSPGGGLVSVTMRRRP